MYVPRRYLMTAMCFFGLMCDNMMRVSMGVAMVAIRDDTSGSYNISAEAAGIILNAGPSALLLSRIPCGILATMWNPKHLFSITSFIMAITFLLIPVCAQVGPGMLFFIYALSGLPQGASNPCTQILLSYWVPAEEKTKLFGFALAGINAGVAFGFTVGSVITSMISLSAMFYIEGSIQLIWLVFFYFWASSTPAEHHSISAEEIAYISESTGTRTRLKVPLTWESLMSLPWKAMLVSGPLWAISVIYVSYMYCFYMSVTIIQQYTDRILQMSLIESGLMLCSPFVLLLFTAPIGGYLCDRAIDRGVHITKVRKYAMTVVEGFQCLGFIAIGYANDSYAGTAICVLMITGVGHIARAFIGANTLDISGPYGGLVLAITNTIALIGGISATEIANIFGFTERDGSASTALLNWRIIFAIAALVSAVSAIIYIILGSGERESWATTSDNCDEQEMQEAESLLASKTYPTVDMNGDLAADYSIEQYELEQKTDDELEQH